MTTRMTEILLPPLLGYAACGLVLSLGVHLAALAGFAPPGGNVLFGGIMAGIFGLVLALIAVSKMLPETVDVKTDRWRLPVFAGSPAWMNAMARGIYAYAAIIFAYSVLANFLSTGTPTFSMSHSFGAGDPSIASWRGFSAISMSMYSCGLAVLTSACRAGK
jgi:hypothetical protein